MKYLSSAAIVVSSNSYISASPRTKMYFFYYQYVLMNYCLHQKQSFLPKSK